MIVQNSAGVVIAIDTYGHCSRCDQWKHRDGFYRNKTTASGMSRHCKACRKDYDVRNEDRFREQRKAEYPNKIGYYKKRYRERTEKFAENARKRHARMKHLPSYKAKALVAGALFRAKKAGRDFDINVEDVESVLVNGLCQVSGLPFDMQIENGRSLFSPSIDRRDNTQGYTPNNCNIVAMGFNAGKADQSELDFIAMCCAVAERHASDPAVIQRLKELRNAKF